MTATQKFAAFGLGTCAFYIAISRGLHSFFYVSDSTYVIPYFIYVDISSCILMREYYLDGCRRQERFERVELEKASHRGQAPVR